MHVSYDLVRGFLEGKEKGALSALAGSVCEVCRDDRFSGAGSAREEYAAAAEKSTSTQHRVEPGDPGGNSFGGNLVIKPERGDRKYADSVSSDQKGEFVGAVERAAIFHHAQIPRGNLVVKTVLEENDAIRDVFLKPVTGQLVASPLGRDDGGDAFGLEPAKEAAQLGPQDRFVLQPGK